jgi:hypothetical protein
MTSARTRAAVAVAVAVATALAVAGLAAALLAAAPGRGRRAPALLASWQDIGGCGAGSSTSIGGVKWIGRQVSGGLVEVQSQGNYTRYDDGYSYSLQNQLSADVGERWNLGVVVPWLYKYAYDPYNTNVDVSNRGLGDINALVTRRFGAIQATSLTLSVGFPTATHQAEFMMNPLTQDRQLGAGSTSAALVIDHAMDRLSGPTVLGGSLSYPGKENSLHNYRSPSASVYAYAGYLLGAFVPAVGVTAMGFREQDRDLGQPTDRPQLMGAANASLEWSTDWLAVLAGGSLPFSREGLEPWTISVGMAVAPF